MQSYKIDIDSNNAKTFWHWRHHNISLPCCTNQVKNKKANKVDANCVFFDKKTVLSIKEIHRIAKIKA